MCGRTLRVPYQPHLLKISPLYQGHVVFLCNNLSYFHCLESKPVNNSSVHCEIACDYIDEKSEEQPNYEILFDRRIPYIKFNKEEN